MFTGMFAYFHFTLELHKCTRDKAKSSHSIVDQCRFVFLPLILSFWVDNMYILYIHVVWLYKFFSLQFPPWVTICLPSSVNKMAQDIKMLFAKASSVKTAWAILPYLVSEVGLIYHNWSYRVMAGEYRKKWSLAQKHHSACIPTIQTHLALNLFNRFCQRYVWCLTGCLKRFSQTPI